MRCFALVHRTLVRVVRTVRTPQTTDSGGDDVTVFTFRAMPVTPLANRLARAGVLVCGVAPRRTAAWRGAATLAAGVFSNNVLDGTAQSGRLDVVDAACPHARLHRPAAGLLDGMQSDGLRTP